MKEEIKFLRISLYTDIDSKPGLFMEMRMKEYLLATPLCDWNKPEILELASDICQNAENEREKALAIFEFVRDEIRFGINDSKTSASKTLRLQTGECVTKTNLQIALLRAAKIPARFHAVRCKSEALRGIVPEWLSKRMPAVVSHFWCECNLSGKWISCEAMLDQPLYDSLLQQGNITEEQIPTIDWDGESDLIVLKQWIVEDMGHIASYEEVYSMLDNSRGEEGMPPRIVERLFGWIIYRYLRGYTEKVRQQSH